MAAAHTNAFQMMSLVSLLRLGALASLERLWPCSQPACQLAVPFVWASDIHIKSGTKCWLVPCSAWSLFSADKSFWHDVTVTSCLVQPASIISFWSFRGLYVLHCKYFDKSMRTPIKEVKRMHCAHNQSSTSMGTKETCLSSLLSQQPTDSQPLFKGDILP